MSIYNYIYDYLSFNMNWLIRSKKSDLGNVAAAKIKQLTNELEELDSSKIDSVERIKSGFNHFKTHNYEYVVFLFNMDTPVRFNAFSIWISTFFFFSRGLFIWISTFCPNSNIITTVIKLYNLFYLII